MLKEAPKTRRATIKAIEVASIAVLRGRRRRFLTESLKRLKGVNT
jgi:hypothetical protein